ncbi:hypothetical protein D3C85_405210 [compost metagenome]
MTPENRRPQTPLTREINPGIVPIEEGGERPHIVDAPSVQDINTGEIPTLIPDHSGRLVLTDDERSSDEFQQKTDALRAYHQERTTADTASSHTTRNITIGAASLLLVGGAIGGVAALNNQPSNTPPDTEPSAAGSPIAGETQTPAPTNTAESPLASPTNLGPLETAKPTTVPETKKPTVEVMPASLEQYKAMTIDQFAALPKSEQLTYWSWQSRNLDGFAKKLHETTLDSRDKPVLASETNTAQEIAAIQANNIRFIFSIEDNLEREKALTTVLYDGRASDAYPLWMSHLKQIPSNILNIKLLVKNVAATSDVVPVGPRGIENGITFQDTTLSDGSRLTRGFYVPYQDAQTGTQAATWIRQ